MDDFLSSGIPGHLFRSVDQAPCVPLCGFTPSRAELLLDAFLSLQVSLLNKLVLAPACSMLQFTSNANTLNILTLHRCRGLVKRSLLVQMCLQAQILQILQMDGFEHAKYLIWWPTGILLQLIFAFKRFHFFSSDLLC